LETLLAISLFHLYLETLFLSSQSFDPLRIAKPL